MLSYEELKTLEVAKTVDARGTACPGPLLAAKRALAEVPVGGVMEVLSSDEGTTKDIPKWANKKGHTYLGDLEKDGYYRMFLKKNNPEVYKQIVTRLNRPKGFGENEPLAIKFSGAEKLIIGDNMNPIGRKLNRRIEVEFYNLGKR